jgi:hypothetical protein
MVRPDVSRPLSSRVGPQCFASSTLARFITFFTQCVDRASLGQSLGASKKKAAFTAALYP